MPRAASVRLDAQIAAGQRRQADQRMQQAVAESVADTSRADQQAARRAGVRRAAARRRLS